MFSKLRRTQMKTNLLFLFLISSAFAACTSITSASLANSSLNISAGTCYFVTDWNTTLNSPSVLQNLTFNLTAASNATDSVSGNQYDCKFDLVNVNDSLAFGETYSNANHKIFIQCPDYPKLNLNKTLDYSTSYVDVATNVSIFAPPYFVLNESLNLSCGQIRDFPHELLHIVAPKCLNVDKTLDYGGKYDYTAEGNVVHISAPTRYDLTRTLSTNESFVDNRSGLNLLCAPSTQDFIGFCQKLNDTPPAGVWQMINLSLNDTCEISENICVNKVSEFCTLNEKVGGTVGLVQCYNRNLQGMNEFCKTQQDEANKWQSAYNQLNLSFSQGSAQSQNNDDFAKTVIGGGIGLVFLFFIIHTYLDKKNKERRSV